MILFLHHRYRTNGGEERAVDDLMWLAREHAGEETELLQRDSAQIGRGRAARAMLAGGDHPDDVERAVRRTGATVVHAHNLHPTWGWRSLQAARKAGAAVVMHLHNYRLVCAVGTGINSLGEDCARCKGRHTLPGLRLNCRESRAEALVYASSIAAYSRRLTAQVDAFIAPSAFAKARLLTLAAPVSDIHVLGHAMREFADRSHADTGIHALIASRLVAEKGVDIAVEACRRAGLPLVVAGDGPLHVRPREGVRIVGRVESEELAQLRAQAALELVPSRFPETFGLSAAEAMAAGVPVVASRIGALTELVGEDGLVTPDDVDELAEAALRRYGDNAAGDSGLARVRERCDPVTRGAELAAIYAAVRR